MIPWFTLFLPSYVLSLISEPPDVTVFILRYFFLCDDERAGILQTQVMQSVFYSLRLPLGIYTFLVRKPSSCCGCGWIFFWRKWKTAVFSLFIGSLGAIYARRSKCWLSIIFRHIDWYIQIHPMVRLYYVRWLHNYNMQTWTRVAFDNWRTTLFS